MPSSKGTVPEYIRKARFIIHDEEPPVVSIDLDETDFVWSDTARMRFNEYGDTFKTEDIHQCLTEGVPWKGQNGCTVFVHQQEGLARYTVIRVGRRTKIVTLWAYIWREEWLRDSGKFSSKQIARIKRVVRENSGWFG